QKRTFAPERNEPRSAVTPKRVKGAPVQPPLISFFLWIGMIVGTSSRKSSLSDRPSHRTSLLDRADSSYHHPVPQKAVRKVGTAEVLGDGPYFVSVIALHPPHVVAFKVKIPKAPAATRAIDGTFQVAKMEKVNISKRKVCWEFSFLAHALIAR